VNYREYRYILVNDILALAEEELLAIVARERIHREERQAAPDEGRLVKLAERCRQENSGERVRPVLNAFGLLDPET